MPVDALLELRAKIDEHLPATALKDMNLETELVVQFQTVKALQSRVLEDDETPANQQAQVANSCASTLQQLAKMQGEQYTAERFKQIENLLVRLLNSWPDDMTKDFFRQYEALKI